MHVLLGAKYLVIYCRRYRIREKCSGCFMCDKGLNLDWVRFLVTSSMLAVLMVILMQGIIFDHNPSDSLSCGLGELWDVGLEVWTMVMCV